MAYDRCAGAARHKFTCTDHNFTGYIQLLKAVTGSFNSEFEPIIIQINQSSDEVNETIRLVEARLNTTHRDEAQKNIFETMIYRKERVKAEANRLAQDQLERRSEFWTIESAFSCAKLLKMPQRSVKHPSLNNFPISTTELLTGKLEHNGTALQANGSPARISLCNGLQEAVLACSGSLVTLALEKL